MKLHWAVMPEDATEDELKVIFTQMFTQLCFVESLGKIVIDEHAMPALLEVANHNFSELEAYKRAIDMTAWRLAIKDGHVPPLTPYEK